LIKRQFSCFLAELSFETNSKYPYLFFEGMSDRISLAQAPKGGGRVPPVVANIAELRRSLMGHAREG